MLDIHALHVFLEAARTENFTEAGRHLNLSQPAVSMQIRSLENYLQVELFERDGRSIRLTKAGQSLVPMAQQIVQLTIDTEDRIRAANGRVVGNLAIGCSTASGKYILPHLVARFQRHHPDVRVQIPVVSPAGVMRRVASGDYDIGVLARRDITSSTLDARPFFDDRLELIAPATHPWARRGRIPVQALRKERHIFREQGAACRQIVETALAERGIAPDELDIVMEVGNPEAVAMAVEHDIGVAFSSLLAAVPRLALGRLVVVGVEGLELVNPVEMVTCGARPASLVRQAFLEFIERPASRALIASLASGHGT